jgi:hypothetical protein
MTTQVPRSIVVPVAIDTETLEHQLSVLRVLCSQIGFAVDTALLSLRTAPPAEGDDE